MTCLISVGIPQLSTCLSPSTKASAQLQRVQLLLLRPATSLHGQLKAASRSKTAADSEGPYSGPNGLADQQQCWPPGPGLPNHIYSTWLHRGSHSWLCHNASRHAAVCSSGWLPHLGSAAARPHSSSSSSSSSSRCNVHGTSSSSSGISGRPYSSLCNRGRPFTTTPTPTFISSSSRTPQVLSSNGSPFFTTTRQYSNSAPAEPPVNPLSSIPLYVEVEDTLKLAALIRRFRSRGHLVAQLDPLKRTPGGPWLGPIGDEYTRADHSLMELVSRYPSSATLEEQAAFIGTQLQLQGPASAQRLFHVGSHMPGRRFRTGVG